MTSARKTILNLFFLLGIGISILDMLSKREDFPFAPYSMYSGIYRSEANGKPAYETLVIVFVTPEGGELESQNRFIYPFDNLRLMLSLEKATNDPALLRSRLIGALHINQRISARNSSVPRSIGIRLYRQKATSERKVPQQTGKLADAMLIAEYLPAKEAAK